MSTTKKATKRQHNSRMNINKRQKNSPIDSLNEKMDISNIPLTATTANVLRNKLITFEQNFSATVSNEAFKSRMQYRSMEETEVDTTKKLDNSVSEVPERSQNQILVRKRTKGITKSISTLDKYSPKNIQTPSTITSKSNPTKSKKVVNKIKKFPENLTSSPSTAFSSFAFVESNKSLPEQIERNHSNSDYLHSRVTKTDPNRSQLNIHLTSSASLINFSKIVSEGGNCKNSEEEMLLFFYRLLPFIKELGQDKKHEFKTTVVSTLRQLLD